ncbi:sulfatase-like hydrolase/transferase [Paenibacillus sp. IB182496]|uniref:Sulfatase-like hydrolase/transferase n=1 Tax=Paenibacillus sabuli TaxID=2772509 RepID=A0A927BUE6_9BACL|nr:sulfatase-like hydrolase/transferase [Paenibacillus sabuli]MBD2847018.1 sulfatase-like hydrolase/transferase [Paenibacillus sabuli]
MQQPNILLITTDQQRADCLGVARSAHPVMTPHLDQLAWEGVRFTRAYSDCPLCIPSRTTIMTGRPAYQHGVDTNGEFRIPEQPQDTLPGRLGAAGYQTHAAGKMHFHPPRNRNGFERMRLLPEDYVNWLEQAGYGGMYRGHGMGGNEVHPVFSAVPEAYTATSWTVEESIGFLRQRDTEAPFFMWTSFEAPHPPFDPLESYVRLYDSIAMADPVAGEWNGESAPQWVRHRRLSRKLDLLSEQVVRAARKHYYAMITHIDYALGRLLGELKSQRLWEDTIIVFASDHGEMLGDHGLFHKSCFYEPSAKVPLIVKPARSTPLPLPAGSVCDSPVLLADLYPTLTQLTGCARSGDDAREGRSLLEAMEPGGERRVLYGYIQDEGGLYMATDGSWKYLYYAQDGREQLFRLVDDPDERQDLSGADDEQSRAVLAEYRVRIADQFAAHGLTDGEGALQLGMADESGSDERRHRTANPFAWRGPIHHGGHW